MCKLVLNVGDTVRNINKRSEFLGMLGKVSDVTNWGYTVLFTNKMERLYAKSTAHVYIEKVVNECPCQQPLFKLDLHGKDLDMMIDFIKRGPGETGIYYVQAEEPKRRVLKKVRRNVITGKTQDDFVRDMGHARGVQQFNTRALGKSTGQALACIGQAMMHPGLEIRISQVDHAKSNPLCSTSWTTLDKHFRALVQSLIGNMKGFTITNTHIVFNPIVTEETYVEL